MGFAVHGLVVDHGLQEGSAEVASQAAAQLGQLGCDHAGILTPVVRGPGGLEAAARKARYAALRSALPAPDALVLLGHTRDDQAETVLLGLGRGSGPRSIAGMRPLDPPWARPLLDLPRTATAQACAALGLRPWSDPHNSDPRFTRVRLRNEVLPLLEDVLQGGVAHALARTAVQLREDGEALDALAGELLACSRNADQLDCAMLAEVHPAVRRRVLRRWLLDCGVRELTDLQIRAVDALAGSWKGQGGVWLAGGAVARRVQGCLRLDAPAPATSQRP
jgi:tRNA(Ile)-lysidine synthase